MKVIVLLVLFITSCFCHNWLVSPVSYNGNSNAGSTTKPCDTGPSPTPFEVDQTDGGGSLPCSWSIGHAGQITDNHEVYLLPFSDKDSLETYTASSPEVIASFSTPNSANAISSTTLTWTKPVAAGDYILQYRWNTYRNCAPIKIYAAIPKGAQPIDGKDHLYKVSHGTFNSSSGMIKCDTAYTATSKGNNCKLNAAASFFLALFIIIMVVLIVLVALVVLRRVGVLPEKVATVVEKGENKLFCRK